MKEYRCKHRVEAMRWTDTDANRTEFANWFDTHDTMFMTHGSLIALPDGDPVPEGMWVLWWDDDWVTMDDAAFQDEYETI